MCAEVLAPPGCTARAVSCEKRGWLAALTPHEGGMRPEKLFFWRSSIVRDDMAEFWPQVAGSVPVSKFPLRSSVCSSGSVCRPPSPHLRPRHGLNPYMLQGMLLACAFVGDPGMLPSALQACLTGSSATPAAGRKGGVSCSRSGMRAIHSKYQGKVVAKALRMRVMLTHWGVSQSYCCSARSTASQRQRSSRHLEGSLRTQ